MKRDREEDQEELDRVIAEAVKKYRKKQPLVRDTEALIQRFNGILSDVISEGGFEVTVEDDTFVQFAGKMVYPNQMNMELQKLLLATPGVVRVCCEETETVRESFIVISYTESKALKVAYLAKDREEAQQRQSKIVHAGIGKDADAILYSIQSNLSIDMNEKPMITSRVTSSGVKAVEVTLLIQSPLKNYQLEQLQAGQEGSIEQIVWGPHSTLKKLSLTVEIFIPDVLP